MTKRVRRQPWSDRACGELAKSRLAGTHSTQATASSQQAPGHAAHGLPPVCPVTITPVPQRSLDRQQAGKDKQHTLTLAPAEQAHAHPDHPYPSAASTDTAGRQGQAAYQQASRRFLLRAGRFLLQVIKVF
jgi:hypothetical protein